MICCDVQHPSPSPAPWALETKRVPFLGCQKPLQTASTPTSRRITPLLYPAGQSELLAFVIFRVSAFCQYGVRVCFCYSTFPQLSHFGILGITVRGLERVLGFVSSMVLGWITKLSDWRGFQKPSVLRFDPGCSEGAVEIRGLPEDV